MSIIPNIALHMQNGDNVLVSARHGVGKTQAIRAAAAEVGHKVRYFSCPTLDPYTDVTGIPVPKEDENGKSYLEFVRPDILQDCDGIFFDEFNRAHPKILNAVMELIQFGSVNGVVLPNLKWCWAAINPPGSEYEVEEIDVAIIDRFDFFYQIDPKVDVNYLVGVGIRREIAQCFHDWWVKARQEKGVGKQNAPGRDSQDYISPRRVEKMAASYEKSRNLSLLTHMVPPGVAVDITALTTRLGLTENSLAAKANPQSKFAKIGHSSEWIDRDVSVMRMLRMDLLRYIADNPNDLLTQRDAASKIVSDRSNVTNMIEDFGYVLNAMSGDTIESFFYEIPNDAKRITFKNEFKNNEENQMKYPNLWDFIKDLPTRNVNNVPSLEDLAKGQKSTPKMTHPAINPDRIKERLKQQRMGVSSNPTIVTDN